MNLPSNTFRSKFYVIQKAFCIILLISVFVYTCFRAYLIYITHDEVITLFLHAHIPFKDIILYNQFILSNNHMLNSFLIRFVIMNLGITEFTVRIPALLGHALFLIGMYKIVNKFLDKNFQFFALCLVVLNPFMLDLFSVARGYALGLGFLSFALYYFLKWLEHESLNKNCVYGSNVLCLTSLAILSHFSNFHVYNALFLIFLSYESAYFIHQLNRSNRLLDSFIHFIKRISRIVLPSLIIIVSLCVLPIYKIVRNNELTSGGMSGIWADTLPSLIQMSLYGKLYSSFVSVDLIKWLVVLFLLMAFLILVCQWRIKKGLEAVDRRLLGMFVLLITIIVIIKLQFIVLGTRFVRGRTAVFFIPTFYLFALFMIQKIVSMEKLKLRKIFTYACLGFMILYIGHFLNCVNLTHHFYKEYDASTKQAMYDIYTLNRDKNLDVDALTIGAHFVLTPAINYYNVHFRMKWLDSTSKYDLDKHHDYYYLISDKSRPIQAFELGAQETIEKYDLKIIKEYPLSQTMLAVPRR